MILVVGALVAATVASSAAAKGSGRARHATEIGLSGHATPRHASARRLVRRTSIHAHRRSYAHLAHAHAGRAYAGLRRGPSKGRSRFAQLRTSHIAWHRRGAARMARTDSMVRRYVGSRSAYAATSTGGIQTGGASYYGGGRTANGSFVGAATCAHRTLPFGTRVLVTNLANAHTALLTVNDRGPFVSGRIIDVSTGAAATLGMLHSGTAPVRVQVVGGPG